MCSPSSYVICCQIHIFWFKILLGLHLVSAYEEFCYALQVKKLILINANVYANGTGVLTKLPKSAAYAMVICIDLQRYAEIYSYHCLCFGFSMLSLHFEKS